MLNGVKFNQFHLALIKCLPHLHTYVMVVPIAKTRVYKTVEQWVFLQLVKTRQSFLALKDLVVNCNNK